MHRTHSAPVAGGGPETSGAKLHRASSYDFHTRLMGLGVNGRNSRMIVEMAMIKPGHRVLDVGCGTGNLTFTAERASGSAYGIDASPEMIDVAREKARRLGSGAVFEVGLIEKLAYPDATFHVVISRLVIHHLPDDLKRKGFSEIYRVLKPGGLFFAADFKPPTNPLLAQVVSALVGHRMMQSNAWDLPALLTEAGFVEVACGPTRAALLAFVSGRGGRQIPRGPGDVGDLPPPARRAGGVDR